jgi:hypothetical protein
MQRRDSVRRHEHGPRARPALRCPHAHAPRRVGRHHQSTTTPTPTRAAVPGLPAQRCWRAERARTPTKLKSLSPRERGSPRLERVPAGARPRALAPCRVRPPAAGRPIIPLPSRTLDRRPPLPRARRPMAGGGSDRSRRTSFATDRAVDPASHSPQGIDGWIDRQQAPASNSGGFTHGPRTSSQLIDAIA